MVCWNGRLTLTVSTYIISYLKIRLKFYQTSNVRDTSINNKLFDHSDVVGARRRGSNYICILDLTPGFNELGNHSRKTRQETFKRCDLVRLILEVWLYVVLPLTCNRWCYTYPPAFAKYLEVVALNDQLSVLTTTDDNEKWYGIFWLPTIWRKKYIW